MPALLVTLLFLGLWWLAGQLQMFETSLFPTVAMVVKAFLEELTSGRLLGDWWASISRIFIGGGMAILSGVLLGLLVSRSEMSRKALRPHFNFFRYVSPISWIPFAILWFGVGDMPVIFLIYISSVFPMVTATNAAMERIPVLYLKVGKEYRLSPSNYFFEVILPAILPDLLTAIRVVLGISWVVLVAAEMIAGKQGLGFGIHDARNGLRVDLIVVYMLLIGITGWAMDYVISRFTTSARLRWKHG
ncbi:ABC transporter permease [Bdellovibrio sp. HCB337]|uniref:ABC transporter permease n=1 Tax=Bdellovibrio sp. HCB337 TaxID=3394358 RepID=UPI0039A59783